MQIEEDQESDEHLLQRSTKKNGTMYDGKIQLAVNCKRKTMSPFPSHPCVRAVKKDLENPPNASFHCAFDI